jgi:NAD+ synthase (glutamine-hydrolysing)
MRPFHSIYSHGFVRAAVCILSLRVADPQFNIEQTLGLARRASDLNATVALFPELGIPAYSNEDLFHQDALLDPTTAAIAHLVSESRTLVPVLIAGAPLRFDGSSSTAA